MTEPLFVVTENGKKVRILTPAELDAFAAAIEKEHLRTLFSVCFWTGMRFVEIKHLHDNRDAMLNENTIRMARNGTKRSPPERYIDIPDQIQPVIQSFFNNPRPPTIKVWGENLQRWADKAGIGSDGVSQRMVRSTIESWMCAAEIPMNWICLRQGHRMFLDLYRYKDIPFSDEDREEIRRRLSGWGQCLTHHQPSSQ